MVLRPTNYQLWLGRQAIKKSELKPATKMWKSAKIIKTDQRIKIKGRYRPIYKLVRKVRKR